MVELSAAYNTSVFVVSCEEGLEVVECENFTCPCNSTGLRRRLLQIASPNTRLSVVYKKEKSYNESIVANALQIAYEKPISVLAVAVEQLPTTIIRWDKTILFYRNAIILEATPSPVLTIIAVVAVVLILIGISTLVYCCLATKAGPMGTQVLKAGPMGVQLINVKIAGRQCCHVD